MNKAEGFAIVSSDDTRNEYIANADKAQVLALAQWVMDRKTELFDAGADERFS